MFILRLLLMMAQDVEVASSFQPLLGLAANFLGSHESQVADPMIEAHLPLQPDESDSIERALPRYHYPPLGGPLARRVPNPTQPR